MHVLSVQGCGLYGPQIFPCHMTHIHVCATTITPLLSITMEAEVITSFLPRLVNAIGDCVQPVSDQCLAKGLISHSTYKTILESDKKGEDKARVLIQTVISSTETEGTCLNLFLDSLDQVLPYVVKDKLLSEIKAKQDNTCKSVVPLSQTFQLVPSEQLPRESVALHTKLLGRFEDSIRQHERACAEKNLLEQRLKTKSEECEKLKQELEALKSQNQETSSIREEVARAESRISACESGVDNLKIKLKELEKIKEEQDMRARRGREVVTTETKNFFTLFAKHSQQKLKEAEATVQQRAQEQIRMKEMEHKLKIQEKERRITELEIKSKSQLDVNPSDVLKPANLSNLVRFLGKHSGMYIHDAHQNTVIHGEHESKWRDLGSNLEFSKKELDRIDRESNLQPRLLGLSAHLNKDSPLHGLLRCWLESYPGDKRGSTSFATYTQLKTALLNAGLGTVARDLPSYEEL